MEMYELGMFCSLRTTSQTAIIGGTDKNTNQIRVGSRHVTMKERLF